MELDDRQWDELQVGYRLPYDPRPALAALASGTNTDSVWEELWNELHHQGDVGEASYASLPVLVDIQRGRHGLGWNLYALAACIEIERYRKNNPPVPAWLIESYRTSWQSLVELALDDLRASEDPLLIRAALSVCALGKRQPKLGALISYWDSSEIDQMLEERLAWSELYDTGKAG